jgi:hypothetical protein
MPSGRRINDLPLGLPLERSHLAFWVGSSLTFVDLIALAHLDCSGSMFPEAIRGHFALQEFCDGIARRPRIAAYLRSNRRPRGIQYGPGGRIDARSLEGWITG